MAKKREKPIENPLMRERVGAIVGEAEQGPVKESGDRGVAAPKPQPKRSRPRTRRKQGMKEAHHKTRFSAEEMKDIERFTRTLSSYMRAKVHGSEVTRALWAIALRAEERLPEVSHKAPDLDRPSNGDKLAMAEFEDAIAEFLQRVLR